MAKRNASLLPLLFIFVLLIGVGILSAAWGWYQLQPAKPGVTAEQSFVIPKGSSVRAISRKLQDEGLIRSQYAFQFAVWKSKTGKSIQAGSFRLAPDQTPFEIAQALTTGSEDTWITIKEGLRAEEIGEQLAEVLPNFKLDDPNYKTECLAYEGYLFPETYLVPLEYNARQMCQLLKQQYGTQVPMAMREEMHKGGRTEEEVMTLASIVEREARNPEDMKVVAGILWNRLEIGMPLQVDATLQYAKGYDEGRKTWWSPPMAADKEINSPYNTYKNPGLPPGPISNPGKNAITAATNPTDSEYFYYISNTAGTEMHYAVTYEEHQENIAKYLR